MSDEFKITLDKAELERMSSDDVINLILKATKITATCVVQRADGSIRYDNPELAGHYGEEHLDLKKGSDNG